MQHRAQFVAIKLKKLLPHLMEAGLAIKVGREGASWSWLQRWSSCSCEVFPLTSELFPALELIADG